MNTTTSAVSLLSTSDRALTGRFDVDQMIALTIGMPLNCVDHMMHAWLAIVDIERGKGARRENLIYATSRLKCAEATTYGLKHRDVEKGATEIASLRAALATLGVEVPVYVRPAAI